MSDVSGARAYLRSVPSASSDVIDSTSLSDHLQSLLLRLIQEKPKDTIKQFEAISLQIKQQRLREKTKAAEAAATAATTTAASSSSSAAASSTNRSLGVLGVDIAPSPFFSSDSSKTSLQSYLQRTQDRFKKPKKFNAEGEEEEPEEEPESNAQAPDMQQEAFILQQAGIRFLESEWFRLSRSLQRLCDVTEGIESPRFWGKIYGTRGDYYIVEAKLSEYPDDEEEEEAARQARAADEKREVEEGEEEEDEAKELPPSRTEAWGTGVNEYVYFVASSPEVDAPAGWTRLPKVTPEQLIASRGMRRFLTGDLTAAVFGFPRFPWPEASLLRAQIARITASTALCPRGALLNDEEEPLIALENEEFKGLRSSALLHGDNWVHYRAKILKEGRVEAFVDENAEAEEGEVDEDEMNELQREQKAMKEALKEKPVQILSPASNDKIMITNKKNKKSNKSVAVLATSTTVASKKPLWKFSVSHNADGGLKPLPPPSAGVDADDLPPDAAGTSQVVASAHSLLWPGAISLALGKQYLHVYVGYGLKAAITGATSYRTGPAPFQLEYSPSTTPDKKGRLPIDPTIEQADALPPPREKRTPEEIEEEEEEEKARLKKLAMEEGEPEEEDEEEKENKDDDE